MLEWQNAPNKWDDYVNQIENQGEYQGERQDNQEERPERPEKPERPERPERPGIDLPRKEKK